MIWKKCLSEKDFQYLKKNGAISLNDQIHICPSFAQRKKMTLEHTRYLWRKNVGLIPYNEQLQIIDTDLLDFSLAGTSQQESDHDAVFFVKALPANNSFLLNGRVVTEGFLHHGDRLLMGLDILQFFQHKNTMPRLPAEILPEGLSEQAIKSDLTILLEGETGTGKGHWAKFIHEQRGTRGPFVHLNIASFAPTLIESELFGHQKGAFTGAVVQKTGALKQANGGTLFLDEIDSLPLEIQTKLLLFLDDFKFAPVGSVIVQQVNFKLIIASGRSLTDCVEAKTMRADFYHRIAGGIRVQLQPLRSDKTKIAKFCKEFQAQEAVFIDAQLIEFYQQCNWPGNFRQLKEHLKKKKSLSLQRYIRFDETDELLNVKNISTIAETSNSLIQFDSLKALQKNYIKKMYYHFQQDISQTSKVLMISPKVLKKWVLA